MATEVLVRSTLTEKSTLPTSVLATHQNHPWGFPEFFVISQTALPAILFLPNTQVLRLPIRVAAFGISLAALAWWIGKRRSSSPHPAAHWLVLAVAYLGLMIFHPTTNSFPAGLAQVILYLSVLAPVFWASAMIRSPERLMRLLVILLICNGVNSLVGVLQVYLPEYFMPQEFSNVITALKYGMSNFTYIDSAGKLAIRPPGLFDTPGAVCSAGMVAALLGFVLAVNLKKHIHRFGAFTLGVIGVAAVYLSQVRTSLLIMGGMMLAYVCIIWLVQKQGTKAIVFLGIATVLVVSIFSFTVARAGKASVRRFEALAGNPVSVYYTAGRGEQLQHGFTDLLPAYPLGAGLARWGMMRLYFGDESNVDSSLIWAELQFPAWILDGGVILMMLYCLALLTTAIHELRITKLAGNATLRLVAPMIAAVNIGTLALVFGFTPFTTQLGMQYWFLAGALHGVVQATGLFSNERIRSGQRRFYYLGRHGPRQL